ncbi:hypothetical protein BIU88_02170 [Chlorobaculum limnaeum]|uniref:Uncharacterized protein n=1 Tax=Chlorobaculum limnaeum TaxID=274537 RepID=A0A1D8CZ23_CHLLM|nr:hypothetical protein [Chlorobaculum limnaeum]AOS83053.1 hypothetical protein BIU88_02170 [Chlorobaculum limnaeum]
MPESSSTALNPSQNGVKGWAMMLPVVGLPLGVHAIGGALFAGVGIAVTIAPIALPAAVPLLYSVASNGGFDSIVRKIFPSAATSGAVQKVAINVPHAVGKEAEPVTSTVIQASV